MLYLEDYLELLEQLPQDLRDRFTEVRELDLQVQNSVDFLDQRVRRFFQEARKAKKETREQEYMKIKEGYDKALENAEEKVTMASQIYDLVERYLKKLDQELAKFKMELEADCAGITEILESRSLLYDESPAIDPLISSGTQNNNSNDKWHYTVDPLHAQNGLPHKDHRTPSPFQPSYSPLATPAYSQPSVPSPGSIALSRSQVPSGSAALAIAAAQAVTNTFHQQQGRRGAQASLLASYATARKAEQLGSSLGSLLGTAATTLPRSPSFVDTLSSNSNYRQSTATLSPKPTEVPQALPAPQKMNRKRSQKASTTATSSLQASAPSVVEPPLESGVDWVPDPNEPRYCLCNQVSYGEMVGCDNPDCPIEWFHYGCVGLTDAPKGKWYCPNCSAQIKKRRVR